MLKASVFSQSQVNVWVGPHQQVLVASSAHLLTSLPSLLSPPPSLAHSHPLVALEDSMEHAPPMCYHHWCTLPPEIHKDKSQEATGVHTFTCPICLHTHTCMHTHMHTHAQTHAHTCAHVHTHTHTHTHTCTSDGSITSTAPLLV